MPDPASGGIVVLMVAGLASLVSAIGGVALLYSARPRKGEGRSISEIVRTAPYHRLPAGLVAQNTCRSTQHGMPRGQ